MDIGILKHVIAPQPVGARAFTSIFATRFPHEGKPDAAALINSPLRVC